MQQGTYIHNYQRNVSSPQTGDRTWHPGYEAISRNYYVTPRYKCAYRGFAKQTCLLVSNITHIILIYIVPIDVNENYDDDGISLSIFNLEKMKRFLSPPSDSKNVEDF